MKLEGKIGDRQLFDFLSVPRHGEVIAVFSAGIYIAFSGRIIMLHDAENGTLAFGIGIPTLKDRTKTFGLKSGMEVNVSDNVLSFGKGLLYLKISFQESVKFPCTLEHISSFAQKAKKNPELQSRSSLSIYALNDFYEIDKDQIEDIFARTAYKGINMLLESTDKTHIYEALDRLIGLGRGLTPSLDDFLCGMLFTLNYAEKNCGINLAFLHELCEATVRLAASKTNVYSQCYLLAAAEGGDFSIMRECIENGMSTAFDTSIKKLYNVGSSSGADMLCGMIFAANCIMKQWRILYHKGYDGLFSL